MNTISISVTSAILLPVALITFIAWRVKAGHVLSSPN